MSLQCDVRTTRGRFGLEVTMTAASGETIAIVGPNGAGKTTLLRTLAGLAPCGGWVMVGDRDISAMPPFLRPVAWVPQDGALFPHLTALDNVAFGLGGRRGRDEAARWLTELGLADHLRHRPHQLSGGQAQRVALARALVRRPALLLLDEPLAALDVAARADARRTLRQHLTSYEGLTLLVTHDPVDAATLADRVVALERGRVVQDATPADLARAPRTQWLAGWMGLNAFPGWASGREVHLDSGGRLVSAEASPGNDAQVLAVVPAHAVTLSRTRPQGSARNSWPVVVRELVATGSRVRIQCDGLPAVVAEVTTDAVADLALAEGVEAWASTKATEVTLVPL